MPARSCQLRPHAVERGRKIQAAAVAQLQVCQKLTPSSYPGPAPVPNSLLRNGDLFRSTQAAITDIEVSSLDLKCAQKSDRDVFQTETTAIKACDRNRLADTLSVLTTPPRFAPKRIPKNVRKRKQRSEACEGDGNVQLRESPVFCHVHVYVNAYVHRPFAFLVQVPVEETMEVVAIQYTPRAQCRHQTLTRGCCWQIWGVDGSHLWTTRAALKGVDPQYISEALKTQKRLKLTGKRACSESETLPTHSTLPLIFEPHQDVQGYCALNAVANAFLLQSRTIPSHVYDELIARGPFLALESVVARLRGQAEFRKPKGVCAGPTLLRFLQQQKEGVFAIEFNAHCVTWNAHLQLVIATDPRYGRVHHIDTNGVVPALGITASTRIEKLYRVVTVPMSRRRRHKQWSRKKIKAGLTVF